MAWRLSVGPEGRPSAPGGATGRLASFSHAIDGWRFLVGNEPNMRIHIAAALAVSIAGVALEISAEDWRWLIVAITAVLAAEALNTAVEQACNAVSGEFDPAIKAAKDVAAGGVLITALAATLIGLSVFPPYLSGGVAYANALAIHSICEGRLPVDR